MNPDLLDTVAIVLIALVNLINTFRLSKLEKRGLCECKSKDSGKTFECC